MTKKFKRATGLEGMDFFDVLERLANTDPNEVNKLRQQKEEIAKDAKDFDKSVSDDQDRVLRRMRARRRNGKTS